MIKKSLFLFLTLFFSCQTPRHGISLPETPLGLSETRRVITTVIGQPRAISENGRELFSTYYDHRDLDFDPVKSGRERFYTHVFVLGDRRPYDVLVDVAVEHRKGSQFVLVGYDNERAHKIADRIKKALNESRDKRNVIDDFKPY